ncbi:hypothetical protein C0J52_26985, partial [Blattella germanica]
LRQYSTENYSFTTYGSPSDNCYIAVKPPAPPPPPISSSQPYDSSMATLALSRMLKTFVFVGVGRGRRACGGGRGFLTPAGPPLGGRIPAGGVRRPLPPPRRGGSPPLRPPAPRSATPPRPLSPPRTGFLTPEGGVPLLEPPDPENLTLRNTNANLYHYEAKYNALGRLAMVRNNKS